MAKAVANLRDFLSKVVEAHKTGKNQIWVASELGVSPSAVSSRIKRLLHKGVDMPWVSDRCLGRNANVFEAAIDTLTELGVSNPVIFNEASEWALEPRRRDANVFEEAIDILTELGVSNPVIFNEASKWALRLRSMV